MSTLRGTYASRWNASLLCLSGLLSTLAAPASATAAATLQARLLASAQSWSDKGDTEVARQKIAKLLAMEPQSPEGLAFLADLALRENKLDEAHKILAHMQTRLPAHAATQGLAQVYRVYSEQREKLTRMRLMARAGRSQEAAALARELFPDGAPRFGSLGLEIARLGGQGKRAAGLPAAPAVARARAAAQPGALRDAKSSLAAKASSGTGPHTSPAPSPLAPAMEVAPAQDQAAQDGARAALLQAQADEERKAGRLSPALRLLEDSLQLSPDDAWLRLDLARLYLQLLRVQEARNVADEGVARLPADPDMRFARALLLESLDAEEAALADLQQIPPAQRSQGMRELAQRMAAKQRAQALNGLLQSARSLRSKGQYRQALALLQQARQSTLQAAPADTGVDTPDTPPDPATLAAIDRDLEGLQARRQAWVEVGQIALEKNASEGLGSLRGWERPVVAWLPWGYEGTVFAHADTVQLDAGSYAGSDPFAQPGAQQVGGGLPQRAEGSNLGLGYVGEDWRWDLGETGIGFAVRNWVGGLRRSAERGPLNYSLEVARRPMTGTLLSYAGTQDPRSGAVWGGVVATSAGGRVAGDFGPISASFSASVATLSGQNVADNHRLQWRLAADRDLYRSPHQTLNIGLALSGLYHEKDLSGYTWGQGGYYSPVRNLSLAAPLQWSGREGLLSWLLKASVSMSDSFSSASDYYPGNAAMQAQDNRAYRAGGSNGTGWALSGAAEYQASPRLAVGARLEHEESDFYTPLSLLVYARYVFDPVRQPLAQRPRPVQAYSQF